MPLFFMGLFSALPESMPGGKKKAKHLRSKITFLFSNINALSHFAQSYLANKYTFQKPSKLVTRRLKTSEQVMASRDTSASPAVNDIQARAQYQALSSFTVFSKLPLELRLIIWNHALPKGILPKGD